MSAPEMPETPELTAAAWLLTFDPMKTVIAPLVDWIEPIGYLCLSSRLEALI